jgi:hypothetical protein
MIGMTLFIERKLSAGKYRCKIGSIQNRTRFLDLDPFHRNDNEEFATKFLAC